MKKILRLPKPNNLLYLGMLLMIIKVSFSESKILLYNDIVDNLLSWGATGILAFYIMQQRFSIKKLIIYSVVTLMSLYSTVVTGQYGFLITIITILAVSDKNFEKIIYFIYKWELCFFIVHTFLSIFWGMIPSNSLTQVIYGVGRFDFGFLHPNTFSAYLFNLIIMWIWINYDKITYKTIMRIFLISTVAYMFTKTRTTYIDIILICLMLFIFNNKKQNKILSRIAMGIVPIISIFIFIFISHYTNDNLFILTIDNLLSARIRLGAYAYTNYGVSLLGQNIENVHMVWDSYWRLNEFTFDCTYYSLMVMQGYIWLLIIVIGFYLLAKKNDNKINIAIVAWSLYAVTEVHGLNGFKCFPILLLALLISSRKKFRIREAREEELHGNKNLNYNTYL